jgi:hypothetical protein
MAGSGWSNQITSLIIIEEGTGFSGLFFYSPTIGAGNLIISIASQAGTDPYGNKYQQGVAVYSSETGPYADLVDGGLALSIGEAYDAFGRGIIVAGTQGAGATLQSILTITGPSTGGGGGEINMYSRSADGTTDPSYIQLQQDVTTGTQITGAALQNDNTTGPKIMHTGHYTGTVSGATGQVTFAHGAGFTPTFALFTPVGHFSQGNWDSTFGTNGLAATQARLQAYGPTGTFIGNGTAVDFFAMFMA